MVFRLYEDDSRGARAVERDAASAAQSSAALDMLTAALRRRRGAGFREVVRRKFRH